MPERTRAARGYRWIVLAVVLTGVGAGGAWPGVSRAAGHAASAAGSDTGAATSPITEVAALEPSAEHRRATEVILDLMRRYHYRKVSIDDALSQHIFERYLESLDPNRSVFLATDIQEFSRYRHLLDDALRAAELQPAYEIFKRFRARMEERTEHAISRLEQPFEFEQDEDYQFDREDATWAESPEALDEIWRKRVKNDFLELRLAGRSDEEITDTLRKRYLRMGRRISQLNANDVYQFFINAYTVSIEPHTAYFSPRTSENFKIRMSLSLEGIGAALQTENEHTVVRRIIAGGPAARSKKLSVNDRIVGVGQGLDEQVVDVVSWRLEDVVDLIRGRKGSVVRLQVLPQEALAGEPPRTIALVRDKINLEERAAKRSVIEAKIDGAPVKIGVIDVPTFYLDSVGRAKGQPNYRSTTRDVRRLVDELEEEGIAGIVIDLRGNSGGSLVEATELTGLFIEAGPVVQIRDARGRVQVNEDPDPEVAYTGPLAVLVDRRSASASEIFAGAIQDYRRGVIIGEPTFGKGTVQNLFDLDRRGGLGQLKVTIAQFFRVNGEGTQHRGVVPSIVYETAIDAEAHGERALDNALPWASVRPARYAPFPDLERAYAYARSEHVRRVRSDARFTLLLDEVASQERIRALKTVSLVEQRRKAEWEERREAKEKRENLYRKALGLDGDPDSEPAEGEAATEEAPDILLEEAAQILADIISQDAARAPKVADSARVSG